MENKDVFVGVFTILAGLFSIAGAIFNWDYFFESRKASFFMAVLGRTGSRIFYALLGFFLFYLSYQIWTGK